MKETPLRFVTAAALFDGHDVSINIIRRILQQEGAEVIHLGHNRSVQEIVTTAIQEDVDGICVSSYQGGHIEFFTYMMDLLREKKASHIQVFGGGGGVILPKEIQALHQYGVAKIFSPEDGRELGLVGMIHYMLDRCQDARAQREHKGLTLPEEITAVEKGELVTHDISNKGIVLGITGTGGAGKSSLTDELIRRFLLDYSQLKIGVLCVDPTKKKTGGALLGDRIRMNAVYHPNVYMRSLATRGANSEISLSVREAISLLKKDGYTFIIIETSGIGQGDAAVVDVSDYSLYVMTSEYGAPSQLEKIDMLDYADFIAINKFDRGGSKDAMRYVQKQYQRSRNLFSTPLEELPIFGTMASYFFDTGVQSLYENIVEKLHDEKIIEKRPKSMTSIRSEAALLIPPERKNYLQQIVKTVRDYHMATKKDEEVLTKIYGIQSIVEDIEDERMQSLLRKKWSDYEKCLSQDARTFLKEWAHLKEQYNEPFLSYDVRGQKKQQSLRFTSLSGLSLPKVALPTYKNWGDLYNWYRKENVPGRFPYTAGVFQLKRGDEDPKRQFAGEGTPERTNRRFHYLSHGEAAKRLSVAFDSVTLYGEDPSERPDIFGKIGESGVSICTLENMKALFSGFDLCHPATSVSMTINGPAPIILAMFLNTAVEQQVEKAERQYERKLTDMEYEVIQLSTLQQTRGTVQADILKEDQGQNTCIFSTDFALKLMGDVQEYFIEKRVRNYYSVSISGYHIAEAGANPISQVAFTLANGFTYTEYYLSRGMNIDDFAPNLSFFFSNGLDPEYAVIGRVARRIWSVALRNLYNGNERSAKLKYHVQTSGRSLHAQEMSFNDIRTTLQALLAYYDHCNSLHTNAYDEAVTTPTEESVRRAMAIQLIISKEYGLAKNENPQQGSFIIEELTSLVEEAVLEEFLRLNERGGVLGAMEMQYQRGKIQDESMYYEMLKHEGKLPIIGVNTFMNAKEVADERNTMSVARASDEEKWSQLHHVQQFKQQNHEAATKQLQQLQEAVINNENIFKQLMTTVKFCSLGQITNALYEVGGRYRRNI